MTVLTMIPADTELSVHVEQQQDLPIGIAAAVFDSPARTYRYLLTRVWDPTVRPAVFLMLNPSTADAFAEDPTIRRCIGFARREGSGGLVVVNLFGLRSTDPRALLRHPDPVGRHNDAFLRQACVLGRVVVAAWGAAPVAAERGRAVAGELTARGIELHCLGTTSAGQPRHPLYLPKDAGLERYEVAA